MLRPCDAMPFTTDNITVILALAVLQICAVTDALSYRIPNALTFPSMLIGLALSFATNPGEGLFRLSLGLVLFYLGRLRIMGMGDLKLWLAVLFLRGGYESSLMMVIAALFMFVICLLTDTDGALSLIKRLLSPLFKNAPETQNPSTVYPFGVFMAAAYPIALIINTGRVL